MQAYSDPKRVDDPHALPDVEVFYMDEDEAEAYGRGTECTYGRGWYWQACFPGCLPDSDPIGPFTTEAEALADAQSGAED